ncbi:MAG: iron ABC transporter permease [Spirochaetales bacterium]|nr:iron ABC transporter permease [Spirochaetales bacterium]MBQ4500238.1 iron ABC transporter permease [Spirochaetales bacterium]MBQ7282262.1 iron ABC transporter permease [Spirochaetales bacterium]MBQ9810404.1 iron ABC transporter permease [Spirochaetales bacterium]MBR6235325.1 iron ABC transporter permease [Spirochaetales bacterium]
MKETRRRPFAVGIVLAAILVILAFAGICLGSVRITVSDIVRAVFNPSSISRNTAYIIRNLRIPRILSAILTGASLALCGVVFQSVFRNPMADSYVLGVSSGASFFVGLGFVVGISFVDVSLPVVAFCGSILTTALLFLISRRNTGTLLLSGIALNFFLSAMTTLTIYLSNRQADNILFWTLGSLGSSSWPRLLILCVVTIAATLVVGRNTEAMDLLLMDDSTAISSGLNVKAVRIILLVTASIVTATVVCFCGIIGFVGLMSPHFMRILVGPKHRRLLPLSMLMGAVILLFADIVCRSLIAPSELPIGIITSVLGAPVFLMLLRRKRHG